MDQRLKFLFDKYYSDTANSTDLEEFFEILHSDTDDNSLEMLMDQKLTSGTLEEIHQESDYYPAGSAERILTRVFQADEQSQVKRLPVIKPKIQMIAIAAAMAMVFLSIGLWLIKKSENIKPGDNMVAVQHILPGKQGATLTLANGRKVSLSETAEGELASQAGIKISKTKDGQLIYDRTGSEQGVEQGYNTLSTAKGETYRLRLPDGSLVWLNAASSITYSAGLIEHGVRRLKLSGEGYFQVAKDKSHPFIVETKNQQIEVTGTHFNVNAYPDDSATMTTLVEGAVRVRPALKTALSTTSSASKPALDIINLKPGQQAATTPSGVKVISVDASLYTDWKDGIFTFKEESLSSILRKISRWYDVEVAYQGGGHSSTTYSGSISRYTDIKNVLKLLQDNSGIRFKLKARTLTVIQD
ncbi:FecR domain-containing protein [Pedobacter panaciterrae]|uniref:FecR domain-containing protein n=1 Tax=Pedobacter panaciterrae TaxID=363849 RepID=A0ABU8NHM6_9SPHI